MVLKTKEEILKKVRDRVLKNNHLNLAVLGHVDSGKSTLVGNLMVLTKNIRPEIIEKYKREAATLNKQTFEFAWVMDKLKEERKRGITIDISHKEFHTTTKYYTIVDCPGHKDFVKNSITGMAQAEIAILVINSGTKITNQPQALEHLALARSTPIKKIIVVINKMDEVNYDQVKFEELKKELIPRLNRGQNYREKNIEDYIFIPTSAYLGDNLFTKSEKMPWYKGNPLYQILDELPMPISNYEKPVLLSVSDVLPVPGIGMVVTGKLIEGYLYPGLKIIVKPSNKISEVKSIEMHNKSISVAIPGDNVGLSLKDVTKKDIKRGSVLCALKNSPKLVKTFEATVRIGGRYDIREKADNVIHINTTHVTCKVLKILKVWNPRTNEVLKPELPNRTAPCVIKRGFAANVLYEPAKKFLIGSFEDFPEISHFSIREGSETIGLGKCIKVTPLDSETSE